MWDLRLYVVQRVTALIMAPLILVHLWIIFYATGIGLSAADILSRTQGSIGWAIFYAVFVIAAALHGAIGVRGVLREWTSLRGVALEAVMVVFAVLLIALGTRAVIGVTLA